MKKLLLLVSVLAASSAYAQNTGKSPWTGASVKSSVTAPAPVAPQNGMPTNPQGVPMPNNQAQPQNIIQNQPQNGIIPGMVMPGIPGMTAVDPNSVPVENIDVPSKYIGKVNGLSMFKSQDGKIYMTQSSKDKKVIRAPKLAAVDGMAQANAGGNSGLPGRNAPPPDLPNSVGNVNIKR